MDGKSIEQAACLTGHSAEVLRASWKQDETLIATGSQPRWFCPGLFDVQIAESALKHRTRVQGQRTRLLVSGSCRKSMDQNVCLFSGAIAKNCTAVNGCAAMTTICSQLAAALLPFGTLPRPRNSRKRSLLAPQCLVRLTGITSHMCL